VGPIEGTYSYRSVFELLRFVDVAAGRYDDGHLGHGGAQCDDFRGALSCIHRLHGTLHYSPLAHAVLVHGASVVEGFHSPVEYMGLERLVVRVDLSRARSAHDLHLKALVAEQGLVPGHQQRQIVHNVHHGNPDFLEFHRCCHSSPRVVRVGMPLSSRCGLVVSTQAVPGFTDSAASLPLRSPAVLGATVPGFRAQRFPGCARAGTLRGSQC